MRTTLLKVYKVVLPITIVIITAILGALAQSSASFGPLVGPVVASVSALVLAWIDKHKAQPAVVRALSLPTTSPSPAPSTNGRYHP